MSQIFALIFVTLVFYNICVEANDLAQIKNNNALNSYYLSETNDHKTNSRTVLLCFTYLFCFTDFFKILDFSCVFFSYV